MGGSEQTIVTHDLRAAFGSPRLLRDETSSICPIRSEGLQLSLAGRRSTFGSEGEDTGTPLAGKRAALDAVDDPS